MTATQLLEHVFPWEDAPGVDHRHVWGPVTFSRLAGTPHRACTGTDCPMITLDLEDE